MHTETTKIFKSGGSWAVRIPQSMKFDEDIEDVYITANAGRLIIQPQKSSLQTFFDTHFDTPVDPDFMVDREDRPPEDKDLF